MREGGGVAPASERQRHVVVEDDLVAVGVQRGVRRVLVVVHRQQRAELPGRFVDRRRAVRLLAQREQIDVGAEPAAAQLRGEPPDALRAAVTRRARRRSLSLVTSALIDWRTRPADNTAAPPMPPD